MTSPTTDPVDMLAAIVDEVHAGGASYSGISLSARLDDIVQRLRSSGGASAEPEKGSKAWQEIQGLRGSNARHRIEMDIIERLLAGETDEPMMEYWTDVHDRIQALVRRASGEPTETLYTAKDVEALFAIRDAAVAAHAAKPVATAWMRDGVIENAFPRPPRSAEEWAKYDADGYWKAKGYSEAPLYSAPPSPPEPGEKWQPIETAPRDMRRILIASIVDGEYQWAYVSRPIEGSWQIFTGRGGKEAVWLASHPTHWMPLPPPLTKGDERG